MLLCLVYIYILAVHYKKSRELHIVPLIFILFHLNLNIILYDFFPILQRTYSLVGKKLEVKDKMKEVRGKMWEVEVKGRDKKKKKLKIRCKDNHKNPKCKFFFNFFLIFFKNFQNHCY